MVGVEIGKERSLKNTLQLSGTERSTDEPPEKQFKPTMV